MAVRYTDPEIATFLQERKILPTDWQARARMASKLCHKEQQLDVDGADGSKFRLILRQSTVNLLDYSAILAVLFPRTYHVFRLRRHNGRSHQHTNRLEGRSFYDFHIHMATERYQENGLREDAYAEPTDRYTTFEEALSCLLSDAHFDVTPGLQPYLFEGI